MTSTYNQSPFSIDLNEDQNHIFSSKTTEDASSSSSCISYPFFINPPHEDSGFYFTEFQPLQHPQEQANIHASPHGVSSWNQPSLGNETKNGLKIPVSKKQQTNDQDQRENSSVKWMSSKMRLMRKMMTSDQMESNNYVHKFEDKKDRSSPLQDDNSSKNFSNNNNNNSIRVCADCNTTKTPLWRSGPRGPKSLCNACGIRQRKARRALAAAQANANGTICAPEIAAMKTKVQSKEGKANNNHLPFKKRCRFTAQARGRKNKLCFEDYLSIILSKNSAFHQQVFPQDEKEAAILLMALSYGLVHG